MSNSDLWLIFLRTLVARGPASGKLKKVTGHAIEDKQYMRDHHEVRNEAIMNNTADNIADAARNHVHHLELVKFALVLERRHTQYVQFVRALHYIIGRVHLASQTIRKTPAYMMAHLEQSLPPIITFTPCLLDDRLFFERLFFKCTECMLSHYLESQLGIVVGFARLLTRCSFACTTATSALTWIELMYLAIAMTDAPMSHVKSSTARTQKIIHQVR